MRVTRNVAKGGEGGWRAARRTRGGRGGSGWEGASRMRTERRTRRASEGVGDGSEGGGGRRTGRGEDERMNGCVAVGEWNGWPRCEDVIGSMDVLSRTCLSLVRSLVEGVEAPGVA